MTIVAASGLGRTVEEAARTAADRLGAPARAGFVFATRAGSPPPGLAEAVAGCAGAGVLTEAGEIEGGAAAAVLLVAGDVTASATRQRGGGAAAGYAAAKALPPGRAVVALADPAGFDADEFFAGFQEVAGARPIVGGVSGGGRGVTAVGLDGPFSMETAVSHCATPIGPARLITGCSGRAIHRLDGDTPLEALKRDLAGLPAERRNAAARSLLAGIAPVVRKPELERGDFFIRNLIELDQETGAIGVATPVAPGMKFAYHIRDAADAREDLRGRLSSLRSRLGDRKPLFGLYFNCAGRGRGLYGEESVDVGIIRDELGEFPLAGFHGNGELAPLGDRNVLHNYTGVLAVFV